MPRYFFSTSGLASPDLEGIELSDHHAARREAIKYAALAVSKDPDLVLSDFRVEIWDAAHQRLYVILMTVFDASSSGNLL